MNKRKVGDEVEQKVCDILKQKGYVIVERNYRVRQGEIDIVAKEGGYLVFIEVKYRQRQNQGYATDAVNFTKQRQISKVALYYMHDHGICDNVAVRFDVVAVDEHKMTLLKNAFLFCYQ